jgi:hypothetical protein
MFAGFVFRVLRHMRSFFLILWWLPVLLSLSGCGPSLYDLPDPPAREQWQRHSLSPGEDDGASQERFLAAQDSVLTFVEAMNARRFDDAYALLSNETRILLDDLSLSGRGEDVLETGQIRRDGADYRVDALDLFVIRDLAFIEDTHEASSESETYRRKEVYCLGEDAHVHHVVLILEEDVWRIHKAEIDLTPGAPGRRAVDE